MSAEIISASSEKPSDKAARAGALRIWYALSRLDKSAKIALTTLVITLIITPFFLTQRQDVRQRAQVSTPPLQTASNDTSTPAVMITSPLPDQPVNRLHTTVIQAVATDNIGITKVVFLVNGQIFCSVTTQASGQYSCEWKVGGIKAYTLRVTAYDTANNSATSTVRVTTN